MDGNNEKMTLTSLTPTISYHALKKSRRTIEGIAYFYFPLHGLPLDFLVEHLHLFTYFEAAVYQIDELNEQAINRPDSLPTLAATSTGRGRSVGRPCAECCATVPCRGS